MNAGRVDLPAALRRKVVADVDEWLDTTAGRARLELMQRCVDERPDASSVETAVEDLHTQFTMQFKLGDPCRASHSETERRMSAAS